MFLILAILPTIVNLLLGTRISEAQSSTTHQANQSLRHRLRRPLSNEDGLQISLARSMDRVAGVAASVFLLGSEKPPPTRRSTTSAIQGQPALNDKPFLSRQATIGRNSEFHNLTPHDRELLGGIEYRSLKLLLKITVCTLQTTKTLNTVFILTKLKLTFLVFTCSAPSVLLDGSRPRIQNIQSTYSQQDRTKTGGAYRITAPRLF